MQIERKMSKQSTYYREIVKRKRIITIIIYCELTRRIQSHIVNAKIIFKYLLKLKIAIDDTIKISSNLFS